jgi:hypothetical protein
MGPPSLAFGATMKRRQTDEEHRQVRLDDLRKRRDRLLMHPELGPMFRRWEAARRAKSNGSPEPADQPSPIDKMMCDMESVMEASARIFMDKIFERDRPVLVVKHRDDDVEFTNAHMISFDSREEN